LFSMSNLSKRADQSQISLPIPRQNATDERRETHSTSNSAATAPPRDRHFSPSPFILVGTGGLYSGAIARNRLLNCRNSRGNASRTCQAPLAPTKLGRGCL